MEDKELHIPSVYSAIFQYDLHGAIKSRRGEVNFCLHAAFGILSLSASRGPRHNNSKSCFLSRKRILWPYTTFAPATLLGFIVVMYLDMMCRSTFQSSWSILFFSLFDRQVVSTREKIKVHCLLEGLLPAYYELFKVYHVKL